MDHKDLVDPTAVHTVGMMRIFPPGRLAAHLDLLSHGLAGQATMRGPVEGRWLVGWGQEEFPSDDFQPRERGQRIRITIRFRE